MDRWLDGTCLEAPSIRSISIRWHYYLLLQSGHFLLSKPAKCCVFVRSSCSFMPAFSERGQRTIEDVHTMINSSLDFLTPSPHGKIVQIISYMDNVSSYFTKERPSPLHFEGRQLLSKILVEWRSNARREFRWLFNKLQANIGIDSWFCLCITIYSDCVEE